MRPTHPDHPGGPSFRAIPRSPCGFAVSVLSPLSLSLFLQASAARGEEAVDYLPHLRERCNAR